MNIFASGESRRLMAKPAWVLLIFCLFILPSSICFSAEPLPKANDVIFIQSRSGQFFASTPKRIADIPPAETSTNTPKTIKIDPNFAVIIAERIKDRFLFSLNLNDRWKGRIFLTIFPARTHFDPVFVNAQYSDTGWMYYVDLPSYIPLNKLIRVIVEVLLQELADRSAGSKPAELPPWLAPAIAFQIQYEATDISLMEPFTKKTRLEKRKNPLDLIRRQLQSTRALSWEELCWPSDEDLADFSPTNRYNMCSFLFYHHLMRTPDAFNRLHRFFEILPSFWNWQVAFVKAFEPMFYSMRDVEKWWSVTLAAFTGITEYKTLNAEQTIAQLDDILDSPVKIPTSTNEPPAVRRIPLQSIITSYGINQHKDVVRQKIADLISLRQRAHPALISLIDDYRRVLEDYLRRRVTAGFEPESPALPRMNPRSIVQQTVKRLDELDLIRSDVRLYGVDETQFAQPWFEDEESESVIAHPPQTKTTNSPPSKLSGKQLPVKPKK
jgi:hypothetical protein